METFVEGCKDKAERRTERNREASSVSYCFRGIIACMQKPKATCRCKPTRSGGMANVAKGSFPRKISVNGERKQRDDLVTRSSLDPAGCATQITTDFMPVKLYSSFLL